MANHLFDGLMANADPERAFASCPMAAGTLISTSSTYRAASPTGSSNWA
jgi:hypothetical protein